MRVIILFQTPALSVPLVCFADLSSQFAFYS